VVEDATSFTGNATKKAVELARWASAQLEGLKPGTASGEAEGSRWVLADDSGLEVDALDGAPGIHSARFAALDSGAAGNSSDEANNNKLLRLLQTIPRELRTARFRCVLALTPLFRESNINASPVCWQDEFELRTELFEGTCEGHIASQPSGVKGFGYDPLFIPTGYNESFAQLGDAVKNQISHRAKALSKLRNRLLRM
jgi:XTP/dITP diphosphohydrolase